MTDDDRRRLARVEAKLDELLKIARKLWDKESAPPPPPQFLKTLDGRLFQWLGEGSGWGVCTSGKIPPNAKVFTEKPKNQETKNQEGNQDERSHLPAGLDRRPGR